MPCDTRLRRRGARNRRTGRVQAQDQTIQERAIEVREAVARINAGLLKGTIKPKVSPQGGITFVGLGEDELDGVTDAGAYRRIMATGSALAKAEIEKAERLAGRAVDKKVLAHGHHSHDGGLTWHDHKG